MHNQNVGFEEWQAGNLIKKASYHFDALGRRVEKIVEDFEDTAKSKTRMYTYHDNEVLSVYDENINRLTTYTNSLLRTDDPLSMEVTAEGVLAGIAPLTKSYYFFKDGLGSIEAIVDETGNLKQHYVYSSFGKLLKTFNSTGAETTSPEIEPHFTYTSREIDVESGLYHYRARAYSPEQGRFLSSDPDHGKLIKPISHINKYTYVENNPQNLVDPTGRIALTTAILIGAGIGAALAAYDSFKQDMSVSDFAKNVFKGAVIGGLYGATFYFSPEAVTASLIVTGVKSGMSKGNFTQNFYNFGSSATPGLLGGYLVGDGVATYTGDPELSLVFGIAITTYDIIETSCDKEKATKFTRDNLCLKPR